MYRISPFIKEQCTCEKKEKENMKLVDQNKK